MFVALIIAILVLFAVVSATREILLYKKSLSDEGYYLVSKSRRNRRLTISLFLLVEALFLWLGFFVYALETPHTALLFWLTPLLLILLVVYLSILDFRETTRDVDRIFQEARRSALRKLSDTGENFRKS